MRTFKQPIREVDSVFWHQSVRKCHLVFGYARRCRAHLRCFRFLSFSIAEKMIAFQRPFKFRTKGN